MLYEKGGAQKKCGNREKNGLLKIRSTQIIYIGKSIGKINFSGLS